MADCGGFPPTLQPGVAAVKKKREKKKIWLRELVEDRVLEAAGHAPTVGCGRQQLHSAGPVSSEEEMKGKPKPKDGREKKESAVFASFPRPSGAEVWQKKGRERESWEADF